MYRDALKPGDSVEVGLYWVHHYQHRLSHLASVAVARFPECRVCGNKVRFTPAQTGDDARAVWLRHDPDFRESAAEIPLKLKENGGAAGA